MEREYTGRNRRERRAGEETKEEKQVGKHIQLFAKQLTAAICCGMVVWGMCSVRVSKINDYADALGRALRYETDLTQFKEKGAAIGQWIKERFWDNEQKDETIKQ